MLLLASGSPRRTRLLSDAGIEHTVASVEVSETWTPGEAAVPYACRLARAKAEAASRRPGTIVLAADTVVWTSLHDPPLGKPADQREARDTLQLLANPKAPHFVTTACAIIDTRPVELTVDVFHETTRVWMRCLSPGELDIYLNSEQWRDKAGGYGIQDRAASFVRRIEGSYSNVVGLPVAQVVEHLAPLGAGPAGAGP